MKKMTKEMIFNKIRRTIFKAIFTIILVLVKVADKAVFTMFINAKVPFVASYFYRISVNLVGIKYKALELLNV